MTVIRPRKGWRQIHGGIERYRYPLGNGRMLMVVGARVRRWYYGECADVKSTSWKPAGMCTTMRAAMQAAQDMVGQLAADEEHITDHQN
jgi:hypothetical protein